jgi:transcription-repair coupling factor (superfamily II helicase)
MNLSGLLTFLRGQPAYRAVLDEMGNPGELGLIRAARPPVAAALALDTGRPVVLITAEPGRAEELTLWAPGLRVLAFPAAEVGPYERAPRKLATTQERLGVLKTLTEGDSHTVVVASARALVQRVLPREIFLRHSHTLHVDDQIGPEPLLVRWLGIGYEPVSVVTQPGEFGRRGGVLDIYPLTAEWPVRVEFWGDRIESLRRFDPATQRSVETVETADIPPAREAMPVDGPRIAERLAGWFAEADPADLTGPAEDAKRLAQGIPFPLLEYYLPWMVEEHASLLDYLPPKALVLVDDWEALAGVVDEVEREAIQAREQTPPDAPLPIITWAQMADDLACRGAVTLGGQADTALADCFEPGSRYGGQMSDFLKTLRANAGAHLIIVSRHAEPLARAWYDEAGEPGITAQAVEALPPPGTPMFVEGALSAGWLMDAVRDGASTRVLLFSDAEIFGWRPPEPRRRIRRSEPIPEQVFADLIPGDYVVHIEYGIGRFGGLVKRTLGGVEREYLLVNYAGDDNLYVPIYQADRLTRYVGPEDRAPTLNRLGGVEWARARARAQEAAEEIARELLTLYASREVMAGHAFSPDTTWQHELEASFPYEETEDQLQALVETKADMEKPRPMDRLICGDAGYGKTEIALRAAFKAVMDGKQVAMLVPTTILVQQHHETFAERLRSFPVVVESLSRFRGPAEQQAVIEGVKAGTVDIVIGTHRLLSEDVTFRDLGLLIIDEEQRFGVTHKEQLKQMRTHVDVLTMTATPIPRTLYMGLTGVRDISIIRTPPQDRQPVVTHVGRWNEPLVRRAIMDELARGGQVFYVHNRVQTIYSEAKRVAQLAPEARLAIAHGQMSESKLEDVMRQFVAGEIDVLVSTEIVEAGLDIPNANTLIVDRADMFGLSQLYQLRGRVGRGAARAYAYFFHPAVGRLTQEGRSRLESIAENDELGAGFNIAMHDLEIRGAGDILGTRQHGHMAAVGFHLYTRMLARAVQRLRAERDGRFLPMDDELARGALTIELPFEAYIPTHYVLDDALRLGLYRRMADLPDEESIAAMADELRDRFGPLPDEVVNLLYQFQARLLALRASVEAIGGSNGQVSVRLAGMEERDALALRQRLGHDVRVSKTAIWLPHLPGNEWKGVLLEILTRLAA